jgi:uncharacterized protein
MSFQATFYGGAGEVGRSCIFVDSGERNLLLDAGIKLGNKIEYPLIPEGDIGKIQNIAITHAHLDHCGYLPALFSKSISRQRVYATKPTRDLMGILFADYFKVQTMRGEKPAFGENDIKAVMQGIRIEEPDKEFNAGFPARFINSGHILGSMMVRFSHENRSVLYTGDLSMRNTRIMDGAARGVPADTLITENTYGGVTDDLPGAKESMMRFIDSIDSTLKDGGFVLVPSFAVGRAQEILLALDDYMRSGALSRAPIYIDGMIMKAMRIYRQNVIYASESIKMRILTSDDDPFKSRFFHVPRTKDRSDVMKEPAIIITTSGMLLGGPSQTYLEKLCSDPKNKLIIVGYQAKDTPGRRILEGERKVHMGGKVLDIRMKVENIRISGHADRGELIQFIKGVPGLKKIFLVHGENGGVLKDAFEKDYEVCVPALGETHNL